MIRTRKVVVVTALSIITLMFYFDLLRRVFTALIG